ncbi:MAG: sulfotransferase [Chromatiaceae bacterium]|nr:sulfotransferase [Chromatiaceae bacterium]
MHKQSTPFFIVGSQRSGTTMLRLMLNNHSKLSVPFESGFIPDFYRDLERYGDLRQRRNVEGLLAAIRQHPFVVKGNLIPDPGAVLARNPTTYAQLVDAIFGELALRRDKVRWGDKTPSYVEDIDVLWSLFPGCRVVHLVRDGRDVASSLRSLSWGSRDLIKLARDWRWKVMLARKMGEMIPGNYMELHYESLVSEPVASLRRVCGFIGEPFEAGMLQYHENAKGEMPATSMRWHQSSVREPDQRKIQSWRTAMNKADRIVFENVAGDALTMFGYELSTTRQTLGSRVKFARYALFGHA